jgi:hypothetical protein
LSIIKGTGKQYALRLENDMKSQFIELKKYYLAKLPEKINAIEVAWQEYLQQSNEEKLRILYRQLYNMSKSAELYGYKEVSHIAKKIDKALKKKTELLTNGKEKISVLLCQLKNCIKILEDTPK